MTLVECEKNKTVKIAELLEMDFKLKVRLCEIGFFVGSKVKVLKCSKTQKTMLVQVLDSCFVIKRDIAKFIKVEYE